MNKQKQSHISTKTAGLIVRDAIGAVERKMAKGELPGETSENTQKSK